MQFSLLKSAPTDNGQLRHPIAWRFFGFGLTVLTMAYAVGHISGRHFNPAVSFRLLAGGRFSAKDLAPYIVAQCFRSSYLAAALASINGGVGDGSAGSCCNFYDSAVYFGKSYNLGQAFLTEFYLPCSSSSLLWELLINLPTENLLELLLG